MGSGVLKQIVMGVGQEEQHPLGVCWLRISSSGRFCVVMFFLYGSIWFVSVLFYVAHSMCSVLFVVPSIHQTKEKDIDIRVRFIYLCSSNVSNVDSHVKIVVFRSLNERKKPELRS